mmetsp:Transcript_46597/g.149698  ORF Transcript_46597/g.149698 Transcript_46597/m.149698 type:complete len:96 (+) Transcript_46597:927-1214(+)|eukprot:CAMPEP_0177241260 /NCGR_PEP_ID=MMETSP0367-20130122/48171_1 /TAXON_ID=447022 ORGANISM="Scrippsiella hangoei-like, Strain SHHI-4" /NCGR_SAMPLE_ID=MMETSP0367 /ASSEMBLY_ACC=CAM_ASM_000362 /LENGTH=95 /DNA_ID=CAMNT_0018692781 /DNA_START=810 /DNA_END=1097 /DNA_ORIENTATION=+
MWAAAAAAAAAPAAAPAAVAAVAAICAMAAKPGGMKDIIGMGGGGMCRPKFDAGAAPEGVGVAPHDFGVGVDGQLPPSFFPALEPPPPTAPKTES